METMLHQIMGRTTNMKKITRIFSAALAVASMAACSQKFDETNSNLVLGGNEFAAQAEASTKVTIDANWKLSWEAGDQVDIFDGESTNVFSAKTAGASTTLAADDKDFTKESGKTYYAVYPSGANEFAGSEVTLTVAGDRKAASGVYPSAPAVGVTTGSESSFAFKNVCGLVSFEIAADQNITSVVVFGANNEYVAGSVKVNAQTAEYQLVEGTGVKEILLTPAEGNVFAAGRYYVAVLPQEFAAGLSVTLYKNDGTRLRKNLNAFTLGRSTHIDVETGGEFKTQFTIKNADELAAFMAVADKCAAGTVATLANDIDLAGVTLPAVSSFAGTFDGNGKSLKNWTTDKPLFTKIVAGATVKGIVLDASCKLSLKEQSTKPAAFIVAENAGTVSGCTNNANIDYTRSSNLRYRQFGTIVGVSSGKVSDCHNTGNISITIPKLDYEKGNGNNYQHQTIGGVVGAFDAEAETVAVENCTNTGNITFNFHGVSADELRPHMVIGGVCGLAGAEYVAAKSTEAVNNGTISGCTNEGALTFNYEGMIGGGYSIMGGVIGYIEGTVDACNNYGALNLIGGTDSASSFGAPALGGVVAAVVAGDVKGCSNTGVVHMQGKCQGGSDDAAYAGGMRHLCVGGVVGKIGTYNTEVTTYSVSDSKNSGAVSVKTGATPIVHVGGIVGWTSVPVNGSAANKLENSGTVSVLEEADMSELYVGGVIGRTISSFDKIYNAAGGDITVNVTTKRDSKTYIAGIAGYMEKTICSVSGTTHTESATFKQGINKGDISVTGGKYNVDNVFYIAGVVAQTKSNKITSTSYGWADCNSNYGNITINSPAKLCVGGVIGTLNAAAGSGHNGHTERCKYQGTMTVTNPGAGSCIGGIVGKYGRGQLGNANGFGESDSKLGKIIVTGADATTYVGGYAGYLYTDNGAGAVISGCGFRGEVSAEGATAGVIAGYVGMSGKTCKNVIKLGSSASEIPKISTKFKLNGSGVGDFSQESVTESHYFGKIQPSTTSGNPVAGQYFFQKGGTSTNQNSFKDCLLNL